MIVLSNSLNGMDSVWLAVMHHVIVNARRAFIPEVPLV